MKSGKFISKCVAAVLLLLLAISVMPKSILHEALAGHKDAPSCNDVRREAACIHKQGYSCQQSDVVNTQPYQPTECAGINVNLEFVTSTPVFHSVVPAQQSCGAIKERAPPVHA